MKLLHTIEEIVYLEHTDAAGVMYFATLVNFAHHAFESFFAKQGFALSYLIQRSSLPLVHLHAEYYSTCYLGDHLKITLYLQKTTKHTLHFHYRICKHHQLVASVSMIHVCLGQTLPEQLMKIFF
jgi:1,4-dihydroxy-2-naphthoyl-CoA hydrolase|uniref:Ycf83 protein n=2 Tax=Cyanidioschyzon merolae TaxID=45157 RepID=Q85G00_CYAM1|nr:ORF124 [Cyanidioschyzon merolae strain 10D]QFV17087.1 hypothetical protein [Cyanidioschyzon merolae]BAC76192.1 ycf83 [Cyanidioschyzon merolae strain 10D]